MKNLWRLSPLVLILFLSCFPPAKKHSISFATEADFRNFLNRKSNSFPLISAHRGAPTSEFPENAIETFEQGRLWQPLVIEFDVAMTQDSALVLMHDDRLDRTSNGTGLVREQSFEAIRKLNLKDQNGKLTSARIPTLEEVLIWGKDKVLFTVDVKRGVPFSKVVKAIEKAGAARYAIVITYNANQAQEVHQLNPSLMISVSARSVADLDRLNALGVPDNRMVAFVGTSVPDESLFKAFHERGISCIVGTMGNLDKSALANPSNQVYKGILEKGADFISTDELRLSGEDFDAFRNTNKLVIKAHKFQ
ncbi:MAG: glycerophosphodiester phosphodiesterase family protein [Pedobacter sp.]|nr:MAG: glycerophosphodiester phosphodiesterase family protein [Pedobacter sp.]